MTQLRAIPSQVDPACLIDGMLLDKMQNQYVKEQLLNKELGRFSKTEFKIPYGIIKDARGIYAIYKKLIGKYHSREAIPLALIEDPDYSIYGNNKGNTIVYEIYQQFTLANGQFSAPKLAQNIETGEWVTLKTQMLHRRNPTRIFHLEHKNLTALGKAKGEEILRWSKRHFVSKGNFLMQYEKGDDLFDLMEKRNNSDLLEFEWPNLLWLDIVIFVFKAIQELHSKRFLHRDIKLENFIYDFIRNNLATIDFGFAYQGEEKTALQTEECILLSTLTYIAPELKMDKEQDSFLYNEKTEVYALGILAQEILFNQLIESKETFPFELLIKNRDNKIHFRDNQALQDILNHIQAKDLEERITLIEAIQQLHKFRETYAAEHPDELKKIDTLRDKAKQAEETRLLSMIKENEKKAKEHIEEKVEEKVEEKAETKAEIKIEKAEQDGFFSRLQKNIVSCFKWIITLCEKCSRSANTQEEYRHPLLGSPKGMGVKEIADKLGTHPQCIDDQGDHSNIVSPQHLEQPPTSILTHRPPFAPSRLSR